MPHITVEIGTLSLEQKELLVKDLIEQASKITQIPSEFFSITIHELPDSNYGIGGRTIDKLKADYQKQQL